MSSWPTNVLLWSGETNVSGQPIFQEPVKTWAVFQESSFPCHLPPIQKFKGLLLEPVAYKNSILLYSCLVFPLSRNYWFLMVEVIGWYVSTSGSSLQGPQFTPLHLRNAFCMQSVHQHPSDLLLHTCHAALPHISKTTETIGRLPSLIILAGKAARGISNNE